MTWEETEIQLDAIRKKFVILHEIGEKNFTDAQKDEIRKLRESCVELGKIRYSLVGPRK